jgi:hypothetical protein
VTSGDASAGESRSYRPGDWFGIFGEQATVVLPPSEKSRVAALWELVDGGAGFDEVLDALIASGLRELPGFVLVSDVEGETKVVIRGAARAVFTTEDETVTVEGSSATTWAERSLSGVRSMRIVVADSHEGDLAIRTGLVRIARTDRPGHDDATASAELQVVGAHDLSPDVNVMDAAALTPVPEAGAESPLDDDPPTSPQEYAAPVEPQQPEPEQSEPEQSEPAMTVEPEPEPSLTEQAGWAQPAEPAAPTWSPIAPPPAAEGGVEHDGLTQAGNWDPGEFARSQQGIPGQQPAPSVLATPVARLTFSTGEVVDVDRAVIVGRAPEARRFTSTEQPRLVTVASPNQEISSTHLEIRPGAGADHGSAVVTDLGSTNGTVLVQPGLAPEDLQPGIAVQLIPGAIVDLGDGVTIQVGSG